MQSRQDNDKSVLITGAGGLLGARMALSGIGRFSTRLHFHRPPEKETKIRVFCGDLGDRHHIKHLAAEINPDLVVNCAALADVDRCETDPDISYRANVAVVNNLLSAFPGAKLVQISTDYVFGNDPDRGSRPPRADDRPHPINTYGRHKLEAEKAVLAASRKNLVIRVNTLIDHTRKRNFFRFGYDRLKAGQKIRSASDQVSNPISAFGAADLIFRLIDRNAAGIFHLGGREFVSRFDLARRIAHVFDLEEALIEPVTTAALSRPAARPRWAGLDCCLTERFLQTQMPDLGEELSCIKEEMSREAT